MIERRVKIGTPVGLHARPASRFVRRVNGTPPPPEIPPTARLPGYGASSGAVAVRKAKPARTTSSQVTVAPGGGQRG